ncbi:MAG: RAMP superfamily CRISPR-associated protein [Candidatus Helarchaeota archaeon]
MVHYDFLKVNSTRRIKIPEILFTSRSDFKNIYQMILRFKVETPIHIGSSIERWDFKQNDLILENYRSNNEIRIPGSSMKGITSFNYLALTGNNAMSSELFGSTIGNPSISKVFFNDLKIISPNFNPNLENVDRMYRPRKRKPRHVKFYVRRINGGRRAHHGKIESIGRNIKLKTTIEGIGLKEFEVGGILMSLGAYSNESNQLKSKPIKIGYAKPQCFGRLLLLIDNIEIYQYVINNFIIKKSKIEDIINLLASFKMRFNNIDFRFNQLFRDDCLAR